MKAAVLLLGITAGIALSACNPSGGEKNAIARKSDADPNLECAALISAASTLMAGGEVENDPALAKRALGASMLYVNAYAIPKRIKEPEAFAAVKAHRAVLLDELPPATIVSDARHCMQRSPK